MNSQERIDAAVNLKPTDGIPVSPLIIGFAGTCAGMTQGEIYADVDRWIRAMEITYEKIGICDSVFPRWPYDVATMQMLECRIPGRELDACSAVQAVEKELMDRDDYIRIVTNGYTGWFFGHLAGIWGIRLQFPLAMPFIVPRLLRLNLRTRKIRNYWSRRGIPTGFDSACYPPFDLFSLVRSAEHFFYDLMDCPGLVEKASRTAVKSIIRFAKMPLRFGSGHATKKICIYPMRSSASFLSPDMFERFSFPYLKEIVGDFWNEGIVSVLHCDGNWGPMLKFFKELPSRSCIVELDEQTDIFHAKKLLGGHLCLKGNVASPLLAFGSREQVSEYCGQLIREVGKGGGFILSTGCEVPLNAKVENVKAIVDAVRLHCGSRLD